MNESESNRFLQEDPWRIFRIMAEFVESFETLSRVGPAVTIFGSARTAPGDPAYQGAVALARGLAKHNLTVITGGGPGIMEAANKGSARAHGKSVGLNIELPHEQEGNRYANVPVHFLDISFPARCASSNTAWRLCSCPAGSARWTNCLKC